MLNLHPALVAITAALGVLLALLTASAPLIRQILKQHLSNLELERLRSALKGAAFAVSSIAKVTPIRLDDAVAKVLEFAEEEVGKALVEKHAEAAKKYVVALHHDERIPLSLVSPVAFSRRVMK